MHEVFHHVTETGNRQDIDCDIPIKKREHLYGAVLRTSKDCRYPEEGNFFVVQKLPQGQFRFQVARNEHHERTSMWLRIVQWS